MVNIWPSVSIILPAYNAEKTIDQCLKSLINQDYLGKYEIIFVNNHSTDRTTNLAMKYPVRIIDGFDFQGSYYARNIGLDNSKSSIIAFIDSDCLADPNWLSTLVLYLINNPEIAGVGGEILHIEKNSLDVIFGSKLGIRQIKSQNPYLVTANVAYRRRILDEVSNFDITFTSGGDVDLSWRILKKGYQLGFEPNARVFHYPRHSPLTFYKQIYNNGLGWAKNYHKHQIEKNQSSELYSLIKNELQILGAFCSRLVTSIFGKYSNKSIIIMTNFFYGVQILALQLGIIKGFKCVQRAHNQMRELAR